MPRDGFQRDTDITPIVVKGMIALGLFAMIVALWADIARYAP